MSKIFIIDDDVFITRMYERMLHLAQHETVTAQDGMEALAMLQVMKPLPEIILMDVAMPKMNGLELIEHLHASELVKGIPIMVLTNSIKQEDAKKFIDRGATLYVVKMDHEPKEIVQKIEEIISNNK